MLRKLCKLTTNWPALCQLQLSNFLSRIINGKIRWISVVWTLIDNGKSANQIVRTVAIKVKIFLEQHDMCFERGIYTHTFLGHFPFNYKFMHFRSGGIFGKYPEKPKIVEFWKDVSTQIEWKYTSQSFPLSWKIIPENLYKSLLEISRKNVHAIFY